MDPSQIVFFQTLISGLLLGGIYVVVSVGASLAFGVLEIVNAAHGEFVMLGAYLAYYVAEFTGIDPIFSFPLSFIVFFVVGYLLQKLVVNRIMGAPLLINLVLFFGFSIAIANAGLLTLGTGYKITSTSISGQSFWLGPIAVPITRLVMAAVALGFIYVFFRFLQKTFTGKAIRATFFDRDAASLMGVNVKKIYQITLGISVGTAAVAGTLISSIVALIPVMGVTYMIYAFVISVIGGMGYLPGTLIGGFLIGVVVQFVNTYLAAEWVFVILFLLLWVLLLVRPKGILGKGV